MFQAPISEKEETFEFPVPYLYELENRVFTESWSIPYKREESLGRCLLAATKLAQEGNTASEIDHWFLIKELSC